MTADEMATAGAVGQDAVREAVRAALAAQDRCCWARTSASC